MLRPCGPVRPWAALAGLLGLAATVLAAPEPLRAQAQGTVKPAPFDEQRFQPSPHPNDILGIRTSFVPARMTYGAGFLLHYAEDTLLLRWGPARQAAVDQKATLDLSVSLAVAGMLDIAIALPVHVYNDGGRGVLVDTRGMARSGLGDLRIAPRVRFLDPARFAGFGLALDVELTAPTGAEGSFLREDGVTLFPRLVLDYTLLDGELRIALNVGWRSRLGQTRTLVFANPFDTTPGSTIDVLEVGEELHLGLGVDAPLWDRNLDILLDLSAATAPADFFGESNSRYLEVRGGLRYTTDFGLGFTLGAGTGLLDGYGSPEWRIFGGVAFSPRRVVRDADGDGVPDDRDECPDRQEDHDSFQDEDGCPDPDDDRDGILDDQDGCPRDPEDVDGFQDDDGCPDPDNDGDGIPDGEDRCPDLAEDRDGWQDEDGCPDPDNDGDGIPDDRDRCPNEAEDVDGCQDDDGCPDPGRACLTATSIEISETVRFETGKAIIRPESHGILADVATILREHPELRQLEVAGHTDDRGNDRRNLKLSQQRAEAVVAWLVGQGIAPERLIARGYGETEPLVPNDSDEARARNRRVEFRVLRRDEPGEPPPALPDSKGAVETR
jgi:outer membrane protein OmpA-like peptidoglycan-associated protein